MASNSDGEYYSRIHGMHWSLSDDMLLRDSSNFSVQCCFGIHGLPEVGELG